MIKVLFVCHGNICRSPMAQFVLQNLVNKVGKQDDFYISSSATSSEEIGNAVHRGTLQKMKEMQIPVTPHIARRITKKDFTSYDYLIGMDRENIYNMKKLAPKEMEHKIFSLLDWSKEPRDIADPWYTGNFDETYQDIHEGCTDFLAWLDIKGS